MKKSLITALVIGLSSTLLVSAEENKEKRKGKKALRPIPADILEKFDTDKNGELNGEERKAAREAMKQRILEKYDSNGDGELSKEEREVMKAERKKQMLARFDTDNDGKLSKEERKAMRKATKEKRGGKKAKAENKETAE